MCIWYMSLNMAERLVSDTRVIGKGGKNEYLLQASRVPLFHPVNSYHVAALIWVKHWYRHQECDSVETKSLLLGS